MHEWCYKKAECLKNEIDGLGDNISHEQLEEAYYLSKIFKNIAETDQICHIVKAMEESEENDKIMEKIGMYTDYPEEDKRFYDNYRYANGRFAPKGMGTYRRYSEKMPEMYRDWVDTSESERMRDLDRMSKGRMYYTENGNMGSSRRRMYMESKHSGDKSAKMQKLDEYLNELKEDMKEVVADMTPEEKSMWKTRLTNMASTM